MSNLSDFYKGKHVLVCGASGMTGNALYHYLKTFDADVTGTYHTDEKPRLLCVDFTKLDEVEDIFTCMKFDYVFICCAQTYNAAVCRNNPESLILPNLTMTSHILENSLKHGVKRVCFMSSATVYPPHTSPRRESYLDMNLDPHPLYMSIGWVKRYLEKLCEFYSQRGLSCTIIRPTNIYGPGDKLDPEKCHVIPSFIMRALSGDNPFVVNSAGDGVKDFIHVSDLVRDMSLAMTSPHPLAIYNLCSGEYTSIREVAELIVSLVSGTSVKLQFTNVPDAVSCVSLCRDKFDKDFGTQTYTSLKTGLSEVIQWYSSSLQTQKR